MQYPLRALLWKQRFRSTSSRPGEPYRQCTKVDPIDSASSSVVPATSSGPFDRTATAIESLRPRDEWPRALVLHGGGSAGNPWEGVGRQPVRGRNRSNGSRLDRRHLSGRHGGGADHEWNVTNGGADPEPGVPVNATWFHQRDVGKWKDCDMELPLIRRARASDIPELVRLRGVMFHDMRVHGATTEWIDHTHRTLEHQLADETIVGAVMDRVDEPGLCASGLLNVQQGLGSPRFPNGVLGRVGSVAVDPQWRRQGIGESVLRFLIDVARQRGVERIELHATPDGEQIYRRLGFRDRQGGLELRLEL